MCVVLEGKCYGEKGSREGSWGVGGSGGGESKRALGWDGGWEGLTRKVTCKPRPNGGDKGQARRRNQN